VLGPIRLLKSVRRTREGALSPSDTAPPWQSQEEYDRAPQSDPAATKRVLRRRVRRPYYSARFGPRPPKLPTFKALLLLWPTWLSYAVSYLFIAIVWTNHHYLLRHATEATPRLLWFNFAHLFSMSLLPLSTAWMAVSEWRRNRLPSMRRSSSSQMQLTICLVWELIDRMPIDEISPTVRRIMRLRSIATLFLFGVAAVMALKYPLAGLGICICCLIVYLKPDPPGAGKRMSQG
jgi:uncharacterized membrane protein